ncbi:asparagine synthase-related protein [Paenibacillus hexagrammi]|uniref:asparagine synthase (glutamine-hydrolyzing) n=1 Tax=Paenibacillus hexagrammi TaxID=2908839 RepID=A0ABY3SJ63_9BACL|nr:asparagine synthase-related protein [Paenibacillus sp. YPD9-1]UJF33932.1 asparagine synthase-related protein [Paenibacillus sp. YPD9-1]
MSAIAGIFSYNKEAISSDSLDKMMQHLQKYPADSAGLWQGQGSYVSLLCHAQWVTPESVGESMPVYDSDHKIAITADVIIDNREELFERLHIGQAYRKRMTDAELLIRAYVKWGQDSPQYILGDYAYVLWDENKGLLFGARDLLGNRTLYYMEHQGRFACCTVVQPLLDLPGYKTELNESWLAEFLAIPIILDTVDAKATVYKDIYLLPPAHTFTVSQGTLRVRQFGSLQPCGSPLKLKSNMEYEEAFREVFQQAVSSKLRTFRQVGASLSGGLDSGAVVSFASEPLRQAGKQLLAFSYIPPSDFVDWTSRRMMANETPYIQAIANHVGNIKTNYLDFPERSSFDDVDDILDLMEAPYKFIENSFWIKGILEHAQKSDVGVLLNGSRGNYTISWGPAYDYYGQLLRKFKWNRLHNELKYYSRQHQVRRSRSLPIIAKLAFPFLSRFLSLLANRISPG